MIGHDAEALMPEDSAVGELGRCDVDLATGEVTLTAPLRKLFGLAETGRLSLGDIRARIHPEDRQRIAEEIAAALDDASKASVRTRFRVQRPDGSTVWLEAREKIARDGAGRAIGTAGNMHAVTGRKRAEPPADQSWRRFEAALANTSVVVFQQDLALRYTWIHNPKLGFDAQSVLGKTDLELTGPELARPLDAIKRGVIETGQSAR